MGEEKSGSSTLKKKNDLLRCGLAVRIFPATMRTFTKDTALSEQGRGRHGMCELMHGMAGGRHAMCESAFKDLAVFIQGGGFPDHLSSSRLLYK